MHTHTCTQKRNTNMLCYIYFYLLFVICIIVKRNYIVWVCFIMMYICFLHIFATYNLINLQKTYMSFPVSQSVSYWQNLKLFELYVFFFCIILLCLFFLNKIISQKKRNNNIYILKLHWDLFSLQYSRSLIVSKEILG